MKTATSLSELNDLAGAGKLQGLFRISMELYHSGPGIGSSGLKDILKSPAHFQASKLEERSESSSQRFGTLTHLRLLEPDLYKATTHVRRPRPAEPARPAHLAEVNRKSKAGKEALDAWESTWRLEHDAAVVAWEQEGEGKVIISAAEAIDLERIATAAADNALATSILSRGDAEVSCYWTDAETGVLCKARADWLRDGTIFDLKTCYNASAAEFRKAVDKYRYDLSAAFYLDGFSTVMDVANFAWIAAESSPPHCFGFYAADQETLNAGRADYRKALEIYAACEKSGVWPGYAQEFLNLSLARA